MDNKKLTIVLNKLEEAVNEISEMEYEGFVVASKVKKYIHEKRNEINNSIQLNEYKDNMKPSIVDGQSVVIPRFFEDASNRIIKYVDGVLISIPKDIEERSDGSHHFRISFYKKLNDKKYASVRIRFLDGDEYGERFFLNYNYYKGIEHHTPYYGKNIRKNHIPVQFEKEGKIIINEVVNTLGLTIFNKFLK